MRLVALYDGIRTPDPRDSKLHRLAEVPLNHLGYRLDYLNVSEPLPTEPLDDEVLGVISWFESPLADPDSFAEWAAALRTDCGRQPRHIILGTPAVPNYGPSSPAAVAYLALAGLRRNGPERSVAPAARAVDSDPAMIGFEADFLPRGGALASLAVTEGGISHLSLAPNGLETDTPIDLVVTAETGGYANHAALVTYDPRLGDWLWILDPFRFFRAVLGSVPRPAADVTTMYGRRLFFATVQSDGWLALAPARRLGETGAVASALLLQDLIAPFPDIPVTVAVLQGDLDPVLAGPLARRGSEAAKAVFAIPQVQPATNGHDLVRDWKGLHAESGRPVPDDDPALRGRREDEAMLQSAFQALVGVFDPRGERAETETGTARKYAADPFDAEREIAGALEAVSELADGRQIARLFLWSAGSQPTDRELDMLEAAGAVGLGGGPIPSTPRLPHLSALLPVIAPGHRQVYEAFPPDFSFTRSWTAPPGALHGLGLARAWTETPRRLAPFHLAYSAYAAQRFDSRSAIRNALQLARTSDYHVISSAEYVGIAHGFHSLRAERVGPNAWQIRNRGGLQTLRVDDARGLALDIDRSDGVLGATRKGDSLYVALDPGSEAPLMRLAADASPHGIASGSGRPALLDSGVPLRLTSVEGCTSNFRVSGKAGATMRFLLPSGQRLHQGAVAPPVSATVTEQEGDGVVVIQISEAPDGDREFEMAFTCEAS